MGRIIIDTLDQPGNRYCRSLEDGHLLYLAESPLMMSDADREFLLSQRQISSRHKNIAYRPEVDRLNRAVGDKEQETRLLRIMREFSRSAVELFERLLPAYEDGWRLDYASFRPIEEEGRQIRLRARNDLLHVDSFPTRPSHGDRILRMFLNINKDESRRWTTGEPFPDLLRQVWDHPDLPKPVGDQASASRRLIRRLRRNAKSVGLPVAAPSAYDEFMLEFHHYLKENEQYQTNARKDHWEFPPGSTWIVYTDLVPHAVLSGQFALEQTFWVSRQAMIEPEKAPVSVLEGLMGTSLTNTD